MTNKLSKNLQLFMTANIQIMVRGKPTVGGGVGGGEWGTELALWVPATACPLMNSYSLLRTACLLLNLKMKDSLLPRTKIIRT